MIKGLELNMVIYRDNDEDLSIEEFEAIMTENGLNMGGSLLEVDEEGERYEK